MVNLLFIEDADVLTRPGIVKTLYDPACGTGGMLSVAEEYLREPNPDAQLEVFGQGLNDESFAICKSDMVVKGQNPANIGRGNSFSEDGHHDALRWVRCGGRPPSPLCERLTWRGSARQHGHGEGPTMPRDVQRTAFIEREGDGYVALCPELDIASQGRNVEDARANLREGVELFFDAADPSEVERRLHSEVYMTRLDVVCG